MANGSPVVTFHSRAAPSSQAVANVRPSGLKAAARTTSGWDQGGPRGFPVLTFQSRAVRS